MRIDVRIILTLAIITVSMFEPANAYASDIRYGYGSHFGFVNSHYAYSYSYPYFSSAYVVSTLQLAPITAYFQRARSQHIVGGKEVRAYGIACYQNDGSWRMVN